MVVFNNHNSGPAISQLELGLPNVSDTQISLLRNPTVRRTVYRYTPESKVQIRDTFEDIVRDAMCIIEDGF